jgi:hypothetical protein
MSCATTSRLPRRIAAAVLALVVPALAMAATVPATIDLSHTPGLSAGQIVERNIAARGGLEAWRNVETMIWIGHMDSLRAPDPRMGFVLAQKRPNKTRFEVNSTSQKTWRVFDGVQGWKERPDSDGHPDVQPYTARELKFAQQGVVIDAPLIDFEARSGRVELEGEDEIDGHRAYRLMVSPVAGEHRHVWVDAQSFLDIRYERLSYTAAGSPMRVNIRCREFKDFGGLQIPTVIEADSPTKAGSSDKMVIEQVAINTPMDDQIFERPGSGRRTRAGGYGMAQSARNADMAPTGPASAPTGTAAGQ